MEMTRLKNVIFRNSTIRSNHKTNHAENGIKTLPNNFVSLIHYLQIRSDEIINSEVNKVNQVE